MLYFHNILNEVNIEYFTKKFVELFILYYSSVRNISNVLLKYFVFPPTAITLHFKIYILSTSDLHLQSKLYPHVQIKNCQKENVQNYLKKFIHRTFTFHIQILHSQIFHRTNLLSGLTMVEIHSRFLFGNTSSNPSINSIKKSFKVYKTAVKP